ncbi:MAG: HlyD family secretion protein [Anaerolineae bacterium]
MRKRQIVTLAVVLLMVVRCQLLPLRDLDDQNALTSSGFIEVEEITVSNDVGGRITELASRIGNKVENGTLLVRLDSRIPEARLREAQAKVGEAEAQLALARQGASESEIQAAMARWKQAKAQATGACQAWEDMKAILDSPQELDRRIAVTSAQLRAAEAGLARAEAAKEIAEIALGQFEDAREKLAEMPDKVVICNGNCDELRNDLPEPIRDFLTDHPPPEGTYRFGDYEIAIGPGTLTVYRYISASLPVEAHFVPNRYWQAWISLDTAKASYEGLQHVLGRLYELRANPTDVEAEVARAAYRCRQAEARTQVAEAEADALRRGPTSAEIAAVEAQLALAKAELAQRKLTLDKYTLHAPVSGLVLERPLQEGELAAPDTALIVVGDLDVVYLTLYLPASDLGRVFLGQSVSVRVDSVPDRDFEGEVIALGQEAEFPPQAVPQPDERATLVFSVRVQVPNPDHLLKPGIYAEAVFGSQTTTPEQQGRVEELRPTGAQVEGGK